MESIADAAGPAESSTLDRSALQLFAEKLQRKMYLTRGARYQAARRHKLRSMASIWSIIVLSMYVFSCSVVSLVYAADLPTETSRFLTFSSVVMSAFIIAFSVLEQGKQHDLKAELFLKCAQTISILHDRLNFDVATGQITHAEIRSLNEEYQKVVNSFSDNHSELDYRTFRINVGWHKEPADFLYRLSHRLYFRLDCWGMLIAAVVVPPIALAVHLLT